MEIIGGYHILVLWTVYHCKWQEVICPHTYYLLYSAHYLHFKHILLFFSSTELLPSLPTNPSLFMAERYNIYFEAIKINIYIFDGGNVMTMVNCSHVSEGGIHDKTTEIYVCRIFKSFM